MTPDEICVEVVRRRLVIVDTEQGIVYARRFWGKPLGSISSRGYKVCTLHLDGHRKQVKLHRLIWISVHGIPPAGLVPDHINRIKTDNRITNLRLVTQQENSANRRTYSGESNPAAKITFQMAEAIRSCYPELKSYKKVARHFGVSQTLVAKIIRREMWT